MIDLSQCKPGQKLLLRDGRTATYLGPSIWKKTPFKIVDDTGFFYSVSAKGRAYGVIHLCCDVVDMVPN